jgi:hypothetical protein
MLARHGRHLLVAPGAEIPLIKHPNERARIDAKFLADMLDAASEVSAQGALGLGIIPNGSLDGGATLSGRFSVRFEPFISAAGRGVLPALQAFVRVGAPFLARFCATASSTSFRSVSPGSGMPSGASSSVSISSMLSASIIGAIHNRVGRRLDRQVAGGRHMRLARLCKAEPGTEYLTHDVAFRLTR